MSTTPRAMIEVQGISKTFRDTHALSGVDLVAESGRVLALLGPNGAGKTTLVRILTTLLVPDAGSAKVAGLDVVRDAAQVRTVIGLTGQFAAIDLLLTGRENLEMVAELCHFSRRQSKERASQLLDRFDLADVANRLAKTYSGGMRRRLDLAASLISQPPIMVLDEPTTGLDPRTRAAVWRAVEDLVAQGTTVLLTTQYLEEADRLAHHIAVIDHGHVVAEGTANELKAQVGADVLEVQIRGTASFEAALATLSQLGAARTVDRERRMIDLPAPDGVATLRAALDRLDRAQIQVDDIGIRRPSLDDVFMALTGHTAVEVSPGSKKSVKGGDSAHEASSTTVQPSGDSPGNPGRESRLTPTPPRLTKSPALSLRRMSSALSDYWVLTKRNLLRIRRTPRLLLVSSIQPLLLVLMFLYVFGGSLHIPGESYIDYLVPGILVVASLMGATTAVAMSTDLSGGMIDRFRSLPIARSAVLAGRCVADLTRSLLVIAIVLIVGLILGFRFHNGPLGAVGALGVVLATGFAFIWLYALIGMVVKDPETAQLAGVLAIMPFVFASTVFVRVENMPGWLQGFARNQPVSVSVDTVRALCEGGPIAHLALLSALWIVAIVAVCGWLAVAMYRRV